MEKANPRCLSQALKHVVIFTDSSRIQISTTDAAAWRKNTDKWTAEHLGTACTHGIYWAEYKGVQLGLVIALQTASVHTRQITILMDKQSVIKDPQSNKLPITTIDNRKETYKLMSYLNATFTEIQITI